MVFLIVRILSSTLSSRQETVLDLQFLIGLFSSHKTSFESQLAAVARKTRRSIQTTMRSDV